MSEYHTLASAVKIRDDSINCWTLGSWELGTLVSINCSTGEIKYGENYTPDEAARIFWEALGRRAKQ